MQTVIQVDQVSKMFRLGDVGSATLTDDVRRWMQKLRGKGAIMPEASSNDRTQQSDSQYVWALRNVSFDVAQGEIVGLVGRNGAGKSTLLKILSRTTTPTQGEIRMKGHVASLLEVGTGFHPDLSGRDNIYLNGAILGMRKTEIRSKFDQIVEFAGVQRYIDTPVKRYSSGMYVRLAFAVAAHLDPEILIIDEVLAVGDAEFQAKCLGKMKEVSDQGRTVLFVSHNMGAVADLCTRAILLRQGEKVLDGATDAVIRAYVQQNMKLDLNDQEALKDPQNRRGTGEVRFDKITMSDRNGKQGNEFLPGDDIEIRCRLRVHRDVQNLQSSIALRSGRTRDVVTTTGRNPVQGGSFKAGELVEMHYRLPAVSLRPGVYETYFWLGDQRADVAFDVVDNLLAPIVIQTPPDEQAIYQVGYFSLPFEIRSNH